MSFFQPDPLLLAFIPAKQGIFLLLLLPLALVQSLAASGPARVAALVALFLCLLGPAASYVPDLLGLTGPVAVAASWWETLWGGVAMNLSASLALLASAVLPGRRWWGLGLVHVVILGGFLALWAYSLGRFDALPGLLGIAT